MSQQAGRIAIERQGVRDASAEGRPARQPTHSATTERNWDLPDPKGRPLHEVRTTRDEIAQRVEQLMAQLDGG